MSENVAARLASQKCVPCEGGVKPLRPEQVAELLQALPQWRLAEHGKAIERRWQAKDFMAAIGFLQHIAAIAEEQDHHPDLHLTGYRQVRIEIMTHALNGLSENDFILAAKIDQVPIELKK